MCVFSAKGKRTSRWNHTKEPVQYICGNNYRQPFDHWVQFCTLSLPLSVLSVRSPLVIQSRAFACCRKKAGLLHLPAWPIHCVSNIEVSHLQQCNEFSAPLPALPPLCVSPPALWLCWRPSLPTRNSREAEDARRSTLRPLERYALWS
jgi:hypothetical protein